MEFGQNLKRVCPDWEKWGKIHISATNYPFVLIDDSLEAKSKDLPRKIQKTPKNPFFAAMGFPHTQVTQFNTQ